MGKLTNLLIFVLIIVVSCTKKGFENKNPVLQYSDFKSDFYKDYWNADFPNLKNPISVYGMLRVYHIDSVQSPRLTGYAIDAGKDFYFLKFSDSTEYYGDATYLEDSISFICQHYNGIGRVHAICGDLQGKILNVYRIIFRNDIGRYYDNIYSAIQNGTLEEIQKYIAANGFKVTESDSIEINKDTNNTKQSLNNEKFYNYLLPLVIEYNRNIAIIRYFTEKGAEVNNAKILESAIHYCFGNTTDEQIIKYLIEKNFTPPKFLTLDEKLKYNSFIKSNFSANVYEKYLYQ